MTKDEFKRRWELDDNGDNISFEDIANCYEQWFPGRVARTSSIFGVRYAVLRAANTMDAEEFKPTNEED